MTQPVISAYENGSREPSLPMLEKLLEATGHRMQIELIPIPDQPRGIPNTPMGRKLRRCRQAIIAAAEAHGMSNVRVFGSVARGEDTEHSDVDFLVDVNVEGTVSLLDLIGLEQEVSDLLGRPVDLGLASSLKSRVAASALADAIPL